VSLYSLQIITFYDLAIIRFQKFDHQYWNASFWLMWRYDCRPNFFYICALYLRYTSGLGSVVVMLRCDTLCHFPFPIVNFPRSTLFALLSGGAKTGEIAVIIINAGIFAEG